MLELRLDVRLQLRKQKNRGPTRTPCLLYPQNSGLGATKPAHPGIRDSRQG
jgi:hypothetical protein